MEISKRVEKFIKDCTRNCSNYQYSNNQTLAPTPTPWLTPDQARRAVEIAREETIEKACHVIRHKYGHYHYLRGDITEELIKEFVKAIKDD